MADQTYNGWTNRETWCVHVWMNPETVDDVNTIEELIDESYGELVSMGRTNPAFGVLADICYPESVNWDELREAMAEELSV